MYNPGGAAPSGNKEPKEIREQQAVTRSQRLRGLGRVIPESGFKMRKEYFAGKVRPGVLSVMVQRRRVRCSTCPARAAAVRDVRA